MRRIHPYILAFYSVSLAAVSAIGAISANESICSDEEWEASVQQRYQAKEQEEYRNYNENTPTHVKDFYRTNHALQTVNFVTEQKIKYLPLRKQQMGIWEAIAQLDTLVDESDPDISLPQCYHLYQTAEALRRDGHPRWLILTGFIHDLGKILALYGEPQWAVVGDTFPVGCAFSPQIVFPDYFAANPDSTVALYQEKYGIYQPQCGFDHLHMSWGHDEYLYHVVKDYLPPQGSYIIRYHSFYAAHRQNAYDYFMNENDHLMKPWLALFSQYDLYSKSPEKLDIEALKPYYQELVAEFFPEKIYW